MTRTALVTGASRGLGSAIASELANNGANVAINYHSSRDAAEHLSKEIERRGGHAGIFQADVRDEAEVARLAADVSRAFGAVDILVINATGPQPFYSIEEQTWENYLQQLEFFVKSPLLLLKQVLPHMKRQRFGRIIQIGSEVFELVSVAKRLFCHFGNPANTQISSHCPGGRGWVCKREFFGLAK